MVVVMVIMVVVFLMLPFVGGGRGNGDRSGGVVIGAVGG